MLGGPLGRPVGGGLGQARRGGPGTFLRRRWRRRAAFSGRVIGLGAGLVGRRGTLGRSRRVAGVLGLGRRFRGFYLLLLAEFRGETGFEGERARREAGGATAGARVPVAATGARAPRGCIRTSATGSSRSPGEKIDTFRFCFNSTNLVAYLIACVRQLQEITKE